MITKKLFAFFLLITTVCSLCGCEEEDPYYDNSYEIAMDNLCIPGWEDRYETNDGRDCIQQLEFNYNFTGYDYRTYYYPNEATQEERIPFRWEWDKGYTDALYIEYLDRKGIWLEDIWFGRNTMTCIYDGGKDPVTFRGYNK